MHYQKSSSHSGPSTLSSQHIFAFPSINEVTLLSCLLVRQISLSFSALQVLQFASALCREGSSSAGQGFALASLLEYWTHNPKAVTKQSWLYFPLCYFVLSTDLYKFSSDFPPFGFISEAHSSHYVTALMSATKASQVPAQASWPFHVALCWPHWVGWGICENHSFWAVCIFLYQMSDNEMTTLYWTFYLVCSFSNLSNILVSSGKWCFGGCHRCQTLIKSTLSC